MGGTNVVVWLPIHQRRIGTLMPRVVRARSTQEARNLNLSESSRETEKLDHLTR
jgi:hypothetical protein